MKFPSLTKIARAITGRSPQARYDAHAWAEPRTFGATLGVSF